MDVLMPLKRIDFYKADHRRQYPDGTNLVYLNFTPRGSRIAGLDHVVVFGIQYFIERYLVHDFQEGFFLRPRAEVLEEYQDMVDSALGPGAVPVEHIGALWDLQYLPLRIKALPEGALVPTQVPILTVENTHPAFFWLPNYFETLLSAVVWPMCTSATTAREYRRVFEKYARETGADLDFVRWQSHDFSARGMFGPEAGDMSGAGHLLSNYGTDTASAIDLLETYYRADRRGELIGGSVYATEHSVMSAGGSEPDSETATFRRLITERYPSGIVSIVSDTWDFWRVVTDVLPALKSEILNRNGKLVIRPDSGDPVKVLCGDPKAPEGSPERKGLVQCLWEIFGGTTNAQGFKVLDSHIGAIYGDSITLERQEAILSRLKAAGFASSAVVLGIGSFTYQYVTRDTFGFAAKATYCEVYGQPRELFKAPKGDASKNSHRGLLQVYREGGTFRVLQRATRREEMEGELHVVFEDGLRRGQESLALIRSRIDAGLSL